MQKNRIEKAYYRKRKALKQMEVAEKAGISCSYLSKIETGKVRYSLAVLIQIAKVLDIDPGELLTDGSSY
ncbi:helix-turn-helix domain-containing protein [Phascolarctobacterium faecium]|uniref:helix-turn-helix domain-containing protein n=1 Tax=Phascolarctobacterium faecium TaxID=33025 RepID=UPI003529C152